MYVILTNFNVNFKIPSEFALEETEKNASATSVSLTSLEVDPALVSKSLLIKQ